MFPFKVRVVPKHCAIGTVVEIQFRLGSTVLDDSGDTFRVRMMEDLTVRADKIHAAVQFFDEAYRIVILAAMMRNLEGIDLELLRSGVREETINRFFKNVWVGIGGKQALLSLEFR